MNQTPKTIKQIMTDWGKNQQQSPTNSELLKSQSLGQLSASSPATFGKKSFRSVPWTSMVFAGLTLIALLVNPAQQLLNHYSSAPMVPETLTNKSGISAGSGTQELVPSRYFPYPYPTPGPITDTREFIKTDYSANIRSRDIENLIQRIKMAVQGWGGRIDTLNSSERWGYISFVIPADKLENLRIQIKSYTFARLYAENISSENLLGQKQSIEQQQTNYQTSLQQTRDEKSKLDFSHRAHVKELSGRISEIAGEINDLEIRLDVTSDQALREQLLAELSKLNDEKKQLENTLDSENVSYTNRANLLNGQIRDYENVLNGLNQQDQNLIDTVATVRGTVYLSWISIWEIISLYSPINPVALIFALAAIVSYVIYRRRQNRFIILPN